MATNIDDTDPRPPDADDLDPDSDFDGPRAPGNSPPRFGRLALCIAAAAALSFGVIGTVAYGVWFNHDQQAYADAITSARRALGSSEADGARNVAQSTARPAASIPTQRASDEDSMAATVAPATPEQSVANATTHPGAPTWPQAAPPSSLAIPDGPDPAAMSRRPATAREAADERANGHAVWSGQIQPNDPNANPSTMVADASPATPSMMPADTSADTSVDGSTNTSNAAAPNTTPDLYGAPASSPAVTRQAANAANPPTQRASNRPAKNGKLAQQDRRAAPSNAKHKDSLFARVGQFFRRVSYRQHGSGRQQQQDIYSHP
ncbi:hypothetical protein [Paraburkholderia sp. ZP32-5]|uniref:hypothetical protein n=1 Tax=Paraburkholderia sp. ZP32-5 TaxID=2883245 RepID=UPI001F2421C1|nr:hypothetical protein [Paraburkholderia sp. ZP32-5]